MSLHLQDDQLERIRDLQELLATPLGHSSLEAWLTDVHHATTRLFGVDRSLLVLPLGDGEVRVDSPNLEAKALAGLRSALLGTGPQVNEYYDPLLNRAMHRLATSGTELWTREIAQRISGVPLEAMPRFYPEVAKPWRLEGMMVLGHSLDEGRAMLEILPDSAEETEFGEDGIEVLRLLLPAFKAGTRAVAASAARRRGLRRGLDLLEEGVAVYRDGEPSYRNRALQRILAEEDRREELMAEAGRCARRLTRRLRASRPSGEPADAAAVVETPRNRYRLAASHLEGGSDGRPVVVMVVIRPAVPPLPDEPTLVSRYRLTPRQAEIALHLARGRSNLEIAERLGISRHTARHHAQRVLEKLGAVSRKALAMRLLADREV